MSQNFSKMSDIYIPELMELDSYWQKAVEDAICDTLKGEKRLFYALRNRKKIKQKLERLGLKTSNMKIFVSGMSNTRMGYPEGKETSESCSERSVSSLEDEFGGEKKGVGGSWKKNKEETPPEKRLKSPDRPLLGTGSLEKLKKSQNSFNCEPMGYDNAHCELSDSEMGEEVDPWEIPVGKEGDLCEMPMGQEVDLCEIPLVEECSDGSKEIQWLHVRKDQSDFDWSDSETVSNSRVSEAVEKKNDFQKTTSVRDKNYFINNKLGLRLALAQTMKYEKRPSSDSQWDTESEDFPLNPELEKRLQLALAKRDIVNENLNAMSIGNTQIEVQVQGSAVQILEHGRKSKTLLSPFLRFYLEVYRELCHKCSLKEIGEVAGKRWWSMSPKEKSLYGP